ncbi:hypothetical protein EV359DRAFT_76052 [Lentinula novae-zelandiae]|nr:hypothetical protein EV359DRAFT_76052 [Lentinula novae-zelandiae]
MLLVQARLQHLLLLFITLFGLILHVKAGQGFTNGLSIIDAPSSGSPGHAGSVLPIAIDISGDGQLSSDASNPASTASTHFSLLEIYLVSSETGLNITVSSGTGLLAQESGSTVKHINWPVPTCVTAGNYNLTLYETASINGQPHFTITPISIPIENANPSGVSCSQTASVTINPLQTQPQPQNSLTQSPFPGGISSSESGFVTITITGPLPYTLPTTVTVTPSATPTTVVVVSMTTETVTTTGPSGFITKTLTEIAWSSNVAVTAAANDSGFLPVNAGSSTKMEENDTPLPKKARVSDASEGTEPGALTVKPKGKGKAFVDKAPAPTIWQDVELEISSNGKVPVYDDYAESLTVCASSNQITAWLREIGNINSNSYGRFMKEKRRTDGATNGTYYAAYCYFEKVRIAEGKKKTAGRMRNEDKYFDGFPLENRRKGWVIVGR